MPTDPIPLPAEITYEEWTKDWSDDAKELQKIFQECSENWPMPIHPYLRYPWPNAQKVIDKIKERGLDLVAP